MRASAERTNVQVKVSTLIVPVKTRGIYMQRGTGVVEALVTSPQADFNVDSWPEPEAAKSFLSTWAGLCLFQQACCPGNTGEYQSIPCLYDGEAYSARLPVSSGKALDVLITIKREMAAGVKSGRSPTEGWWKQDMAASLGTDDLVGMEEDMRTMLLPLWEYGPVCAICAKMRVSLQCSGCQMESYCLMEHQREDWPTHKAW